MIDAMPSKVLDGIGCDRSLFHFRAVSNSHVTYASQKLI